MPASRFPVEAGHILLFARSIGDENPLYTDPDAAAEAGFDGVLAPPTFVQASAQFTPGHPLRPQPGKVWFGSGSTPSGLSKPRPEAEAASTESAEKGNGGGDKPRSGGGGGTGLHAEQRFDYHRPMKAGDVLAAESKPGRTWTKTGRRGGVLKFAEQVTEYRDAEGELVITATSVSVATEKVVEKS